MTSEQLISLCKPLDISGSVPDKIGMLTQDSREVEEGSVFIAIKGFRTDGHLFIEHAIANGASVIICEETYYTERDVCIMEVSDSRSLLGPLAQAFEGNPAEKMKIIGITGTNGKTTVATLTYQLLKKLGGAHPSLLGTVAKRIDDKELESLLTTSGPIELARDMRKMADSGATHLVMEVSSHAIDQQRIDGINFEVAAFTNLSHDHLDYHDSMKTYAETKKRLFDGLDRDAWAVINADDEYAHFITLDCPARIIDFSFNRSLSYKTELLSNNPEGVKLKIDGVILKSSLAGRFNAYNVVQAVLICKALGYEFTTIARTMDSVSGARGRLERVQPDQEEDESAKLPLVFVDYAHTPDALENVLITLSDLKAENQQLIAIFGCGGDRDTSKRPRMAAIAEQYADRVIVTSDNPRSEDPEKIIDEIMEGFEQPEIAERISDRKAAIQTAISQSDAATCILIAGKGHETYQEAGGEKYKFDDREIALQALRKKHQQEVN